MLFFFDYCHIIDTISKKVIVKGTVVNGLYYLDRDINASSHAYNSDVGFKCSQNMKIWHLRLGHALVNKIQLMPDLPLSTKQIHKVCLTCPMTRFTKLHLPSNLSHASHAFDMLHIDIWAIYKEPTKGNYRFFLTIYCGS